MQGYVTPGDSATGFYVTSYMQGNANRYYRANQLGMYVQDKYQVTPALAFTAGRALRLGWRANRKVRAIFNFSPKLYSYSAVSDTITNPGSSLPATTPTAPRE